MEQMQVKKVKGMEQMQVKIKAAHSDEQIRSEDVEERRARCVKLFGRTGAGRNDQQTTHGVTQRKLMKWPIMRLECHEWSTHPSALVSPSQID